MTDQSQIRALGADLTDMTAKAQEYAVICGEWAEKLADLELDLAAATARAEAAEREMVDWRGEAEAAVDAAIQLRPMTERAEAAERERDEARLERDEVVAAAAAMREALKRVQWMGNEKQTYCPECGRHCSGTHEADCFLGQALASTAGADLLARLRRLEAIEAELRARSDDMPELRVRDFIAALEAQP